MTSERDSRFLERAIELSRYGMENGHGGPFGCIVVKGDEIIGEGFNMVISSKDPTAHAEVVAIRNACKNINDYQLTGCEIYTSCEPCPMCLGAIYWSRPARVVYANTKSEAAAIAFDDDFIYQQINTDMDQRTIPFIHYPHPAAQHVFGQWLAMNDKKIY